MQKQWPDHRVGFLHVGLPAMSLLHSVFWLWM
jgi:hypothetical protein